jgi:hypothetical protein
VDDVEFDSVETRDATITVTHKESRPESDAMAPDATDGGGDDTSDGGQTDDGPTLKDLHEQVAELQESVTAKQDEQEALAMLADAHGMDPGDLSDILTVAEGKDPEAVLDALNGIEAASTEDKENDGMGDDEDDEEEDKSVEKRADEANFEKGSDATATAQKGVTDESSATSGTPSYKALAEQAEAEE